MPATAAGEVGGVGVLRRLLAAARRPVLFTGAGISTESGVPDYRTPGMGLWTKLTPVVWHDWVRKRATRELDWRQLSWMIGELGFAGGAAGPPAPNAGHRAVAALLRAAPHAVLVTQNIDGLHAAGGAPPDRVVELHGSLFRTRCLNCGARRETLALYAECGRDGGPPRCAECGSDMLKNASVMAGEPPTSRIAVSGEVHDHWRAAFARAEAAADAADLFVVLGSSLRTPPANALPLRAQRRGARLAIVNREPTHLDGAADVVVRGELGASLRELFGAARPDGGGGRRGGGGSGSRL